MINTARAARLPLQHQLTYLLGAVDDLGDPADCRFVGVDNLFNSFELNSKLRKRGPQFPQHLSERVVNYLATRLNPDLATSKKYIDETFARALGNFETNIRGKVILTMPPWEGEESEYATSRRISIGMNIRSFEEGLEKAKTSIAEWQTTYTEKASQMSPFDIGRSVLKVLGDMDASEKHIISWGSV